MYNIITIIKGLSFENDIMSDGEKNCLQICNQKIQIFI